MNGFEACRLRAGFTQVEAAEALSVSQPTISLWESGRTFPPGSKIPAVARLYKCKIDDLYAKNIIGSTRTSRTTDRA